MFSEEAKNEISQAIDEFETTFQNVYNTEREINYQGWIDKFDEHIQHLLSGFKKLCFDNGDIVYHKSQSIQLNDKWERIKNRLIKQVKD